MRVVPDGSSLAKTVAVTAALGLVALVLAFAALQIVTGQLNTADVVGRLPEPVQRWFADRAPLAEGWASIDCSDVDESDPDELVDALRAGGLDGFVDVLGAGGGELQVLGEAEVPPDGHVREAVVDPEGRVQVLIVTPGATGHGEGLLRRPGPTVCPLAG